MGSIPGQRTKIAQATPSEKDLLRETFTRMRKKVSGAVVDTGYEGQARIGGDRMPVKRGREGKRQAEEGGFAPSRASRATLHLLASRSPESRSEEVASGREAVDEQAQKDAWGPRGREPALQSAPVSSASVLAQAPSKQRPGVRQARLLWKLV